MLCPKCGGKSGVIDTVKNPVDNEIYRQRKCTDCGRVFYSIETKADCNQDFMEEKWHKYYRRKRRV